MNNITYDRRIFADNFRNLLSLNREKQSDIARLLGVSRSTVSAYCAGTQMPRMDKLEQLARHWGITVSEIIELSSSADLLTAAQIPYNTGADTELDEMLTLLSPAGKAELLRYGKALAQQPEYCCEGRVIQIKHYIIPAAAGYASPIEGEDYELIELPEGAPQNADFCITIQGDSMAPYIRDGAVVYVKRDCPLNEFEVGIFFVDGDVFCKQWCMDYSGTLHLLSANPARRDANIDILADSGRSCVCFGKVLLHEHLPRPVYY